MAIASISLIVVDQILSTFFPIVLSMELGCSMVDKGGFKYDSGI